jgi:hypothetical protein
MAGEWNDAFITHLRAMGDRVRALGGYPLASTTTVTEEAVAQSKNEKNNSRVFTVASSEVRRVVFDSIPEGEFELPAGYIDADTKVAVAPGAGMPMVAAAPKPEPMPVVAAAPKPEPMPVVAAAPKPEPKPMVAAAPKPEPKPMVAAAPPVRSPEPPVAANPPVAVRPSPPLPTGPVVAAAPVRPLPPLPEPPPAGVARPVIQPPTNIIVEGPRRPVTLPPGTAYQPGPTPPGSPAPAFVPLVYTTTRDVPEAVTIDEPEIETDKKKKKKKS